MKDVLIEISENTFVPNFDYEYLKETCKSTG